MKSGTPGFKGYRLTEARESMGLTKTALADLLGVSVAAIANYESDTQTPRPDVMERIYRLLHFPPHFYLKEKAFEDTAPIFFRSMSSATKVARTRISWRLEWLKETVEYLEQFLTLPKVNFPHFDLPLDIAALSMQDIEELAAECRKYWGLGNGVISNSVLLLENNGAIISRGEIGADKLDALSQYPDSSSRPYIFLSSDKLSAARSRFDLAHELGHIILHPNVNKTKINSPGEHKAIESQAHRFSSAFLLPADAFLNDLHTPTIENFKNLKAKWRVSIGMMIKRCENLKIINESSASTLWMSYSRKGYRKCEPLDEALETEEPRLLYRSMKMLLDSDIQTKSDILVNLPYKQSVLEELLNLPKGFLSEEESLIEFKPRLTTAPKNLEISQKGEIIHFRRPTDSD
jgi:Zn-dependent peptidase ImmA (M78 family)/transcriptional regulator with XRE-family HTH domain